MSEMLPERKATKDETHSVETLTMGCRLNAYESDQMQALAKTAGHKNTLIVNSCAVTSEAIRQTRQSIRKAHRENPDRNIIVTGCGAQVAQSNFAAMSEVTHIIANSDKLKGTAWDKATLEASDKTHALKDIFTATDPVTQPIIERQTTQPIPPNQNRARAYVQVQNGCDHRCTFCIIPYGRGHSRSRAIEDVVTEIQNLVDAGHYEVVLTGVDLTSWGGEFTKRQELGDLVAAILKQVPQLGQLRLSSIDAIEIDPLLMQLIKKEERLAPYLHLSLQAGDDMILKRMKRRHSRQEAVELCQSLKAARKDMLLGCDLIAGFPTETDEMHDNSVHLLEDCNISFAHIFPYSPRPGTPAERMPQIARNIVKARAARLRKKATEIQAETLDKFIGTTHLALIEKKKGETLMGRLPNFAPIEIHDVTGQIGATVSVKIKARQNHLLVA